MPDERRGGGLACGAGDPEESRFARGAGQRVGDAADAEAAVGRLEVERAALTAKQASEEAAEAGAATDRDAAAEAVAEIERRVDELATRLAGQGAGPGARRPPNRAVRGGKPRWCPRIWCNSLIDWKPVPSI